MLPTDSKERKRIPLHSGVTAYFPDALIEVAKVSWDGNDKHNPGEKLRWAKEKSTDHEDCIARHTVDALQAGSRAERIRHMASRAWRALAALQIELDPVDAVIIEPEAETVTVRSQGGFAYVDGQRAPQFDTRPSECSDPTCRICHPELCVEGVCADAPAPDVQICLDCGADLNEGDHTAFCLRGLGPRVG